MLILDQETPTPIFESPPCKESPIIFDRVESESEKLEHPNRTNSEYILNVEMSSCKSKVPNRKFPTQLDNKFFLPLPDICSNQSASLEPIISGQRSPSLIFCDGDKFEDEKQFGDQKCKLEYYK